jgi:Kef-type K+ transport system membrane component KefB
VLCRILTELKLLQTPVGVIVLSAGVSNDVVGWILLALCVALVNAGSGLTALWVCFKLGDESIKPDGSRFRSRSY